MAPLFTPDCKHAPYWWDRVPRPELDMSALPAKIDVVVIGSGYTGLNAALQTARGGRSTLVLDAEDAGYGCSTRNGGQISTSVKPSYDQLAARHGADRAARIIREGQASLAWLGEFVANEKIDCDYEIAGRFHAAHAPSQYEALGQRIRNQPKGLEVEAHLVPRTEQHTELGTDVYFGGVIFPRHASVDPARYHQGLLERVRAAGAIVTPRTPALAIERTEAGFKIKTSRASVHARDVVVATNGYTGKLTPWLRRRVIPIGSYMIATEQMPREQMASLMPRRRIVSDTRKVVYYYRASPDGTRILFGGRVSHKETDPRISGPRLHAEMVRIFPEIAQVRISHTWLGFVAYTFDELMHTGRHDGIYFAMGYCGSGVGMGSYLGMRIGQQVLGKSEGRTAFDDLAFETRPLYSGNPWFLAPAVAYYRWQDQRSA
jgi:glycine/D-amino acid oxidase-like deaminating enzyme